jgi:hypothetical protein
MIILSLPFLEIKIKINISGKLGLHMHYNVVHGYISFISAQMKIFIHLATKFFGKF